MKKNKITTECFVERAKKIHGNKYDYSLIQYDGMFEKVIVICPKHGKFLKEAKSFLNKSGCKKCYDDKRGESQKIDKEKFIIKVKKIHKNNYDYSLVEYKNSKTKIKIICNKHGVFEQVPQKHLSGQGCRACGFNKSSVKQSLKSKEDFIKKSKKIHGDKYDYSLADYKNNKTKIKLICPQHGVWEQIPNGHLNGKGCRICSGYAKMNNEEFIKRAYDIHGHKYDYKLVDYKSYIEKVNIICPKHGEFNQCAGSHISGVGCPKCQDSKGEQKIYNWLLKHQIVFQRQKTFNNCKMKRQLYFDFYVPKYNFCIEYDGKQHFESIEFFGGEKTFKELKKRDEFKNRFCKRNDINILRISYRDDIYKVLYEWYNKINK